MVGDQFNITKIYPSNTADNEQYSAFPSIVNETEIVNFLNTRIGANGSFSSNAFNNIIFWWEFTPEDGNDARILMLPSSIQMNNGSVDINVDCDLDHTMAADRGFVNTDGGEWQNVEMTSHLFVKAVDNSTDGYIYFEARSGYPNSKESKCCQDTAYGVRLYWDNAPDKKGRFSFYKREFTGSTIVLDRQTQSTITVDSFYQKWFGVKFIIYNTATTSTTTTTNPTVKLELYLTPVTFANPGHISSNQWRKVGEVEDRAGKNWTRGGAECNAPERDSPITWANPFVHFGWKDGKVIQFNYTSFREIDIEGSFGEDPDPPAPTDPSPDPTVPIPDPSPPEIPTPQLPDTETPLTPSTVTKRLTLRRELVNNLTCRCDGQNSSIPTPPGGGSGGGGGGGGSNPGGTLQLLYRVNFSDNHYVKLASVDDSSSYYLRFGQGVTQRDSNWIGKIIVKVETVISEKEEPRGSSFGGVRCVIRDPNDNIVVTFSPIVKEEDLSNKDKVFVFQNLTNTYKMEYGSKLLWEYDGGDRSDFVQMFMRKDEPLTGTKVVWQANDQDSGEYRDLPDWDIVGKIYYITGQVNTSLTEDDTG